MVIVIGSNPSVASPNCSPFHASTRSRMVLDEWFGDAHTDIIPLNVSDQKKEGNRPLTRNEILNQIPRIIKQLGEYPDAKVVALGKTAEFAMSLTGREFFAMEHPSGCNRKLNDKLYVAEKIKALRAYLKA